MLQLLPQTVEHFLRMDTADFVLGKHLWLLGVVDPDQVDGVHPGSECHSSQLTDRTDQHVHVPLH